MLDSDGGSDANIRKVLEAQSSYDDWLVIQRLQRTANLRIGDDPVAVGLLFTCGGMVAAFVALALVLIWW